MEKPETLYSQMECAEIASEDKLAIFKRYRKNYILYNAIHEERTIEDSLLEVAKVNRPAIRLLPQKENSDNNWKIKQIGELIEEPNFLSRGGCLMLDNFFSGAMYGSIFMFGFSYLSGLFDANLRNELGFCVATLFGATGSLIIAPIFGALCQEERDGKLPLEQARFLDLKVREYDLTHRDEGFIKEHENYKSNKYFLDDFDWEKLKGDRKVHCELVRKLYGE